MLVIFYLFIRSHIKAGNCRQRLELVNEVVADDGDSIVQQRLAKDHKIEHFVHTEFLDTQKIDIIQIKL